MRNRTTIAALLLAAAITFNLVTLWPGVVIETPVLNDSVLHLPLVARTVEALDQGEDPTDFWVPYFAQGYPLFHHYQHLPHLATALLYRVLSWALPLPALFHWICYLLLCTFPLSIYWTGRRLGFTALPAALAGLVASLLSTNGLYGLDMASYVWRGYGLYTQLWGMWLLGPAVAGLYLTLRKGRSYAGTAALLAATLLSHTVLGYVALLSGVLFLFLAGVPAAGRRVLRLAAVLLLVALLCSYFLVPFIQDRLYMNRSVWEDPAKYDAYGWQWTINALITGQLLDFGRFPTLTLLAAVGVVVCLFHWDDERFRMPLAFFGFWLFLYFGRPTWGILLRLLPLGQDLHLHRLIAPVHLGAIGLAGVGLAWLWERALAFRQRWPLVVVIILTIGLMGPVYYERASYLADNGRWMRENVAAEQADGGALEALLSDLKAVPPARIYAGRGANWGQEYRLGSVPVYALLVQHRFDSPGYLYHALSLNADIEGYLDETRPATFNLFNLRYVIAPEGQSVPAFAQPLTAYGRHRLYGVPTTGYFDLVDSEITLYGSRDDWFAAARAWLQSTWVEARQHPAIVFGETPAGAPSLADGPAIFPNQSPPQREACGRLWGEQIAGNTYQVHLEATRPCWLLLKQSFHPGWQVTMDGAPADPHMLAPSFVGVAVEPGRHEAVFQYKASPLRLPLGLAGLLVLLLAAGLEWRRERWQAWTGAIRAEMEGPRAALDGLWRSLSAPLAAAWNQEGKWLAALLLVVLLTGLPTLQLKQMTGHDALEYLPRTVEFYRGLQEGQVLPRWAPDLSWGYGQPFFLFNPPLVYYMASAFHALGLGYVTSLDLTCLLLLALAGLGMYFLAREFFGRNGGLAAGAAYVLAPFTLVNLYVRHALADYAAMAWIPWAFWGLWRWAYSPSPRADLNMKVRMRYLFVAAGAIALLPLSSNPVALMTVPVLLLYLVFLAVRARSWPALGRGAWALGLGLALPAFFWLPALLERRWVQLGNLLTGYLSYQNHFLYLHQLVYSPWGYGLSLPGTQDEMSFGLGLAHLVLLAAALIFSRPLRAQLRESREGWAHFWLSFWLLILVALLATHNSIWLWNNVSLLQYLEFPWRFLVLAAFATALICGFLFLAIQEPRRRRWLLAAVLLGLLITQMPHAYPEGYYELNEADYAPEAIAARGLAVTTTREYEPVWAGEELPGPAPASRLILVGGRVRVLESDLRGAHYNWLLEADGPAQLRVATFYYPGWRLTVDGEPRPLTVQNPYGLMDFTLEAGIHRVQLSFGLTPLRGWAIGISGVALLGLALTAILFRRR